MILEANSQFPQLAMAILVPYIPPDSVQDSSPAPTQMGSPVTMPAQQGNALPHRPLNPQVDGVEAEWHTLQDKGFSDAAIGTILTATCDTTQKVYKGRWKCFVSRCRERIQNPIHTSVMHILDFLQLKAEVLAMNTVKGYVIAISHRHALVRGAPLSLDPSIKRWIKVLEHIKGIPYLIMLPSAWS